jgi:hypothetical protein
MIFLPWQVPAQVSEGLKLITDAVERWAIPLVAIGSVSMAVIQAVKNVTPLRNQFQRRRLRRWLSESYGGNHENRFRKWLGTTFSGRHERGDRSYIDDDRGSIGSDPADSGADPVEDVEHTETAEQELVRSVDRVEQDLISLASSGDKEAFYDAPIEDLCDQIRKVLSVVLDYPDMHKELLYCLARNGGRGDVETILKGHDLDCPDVPTPKAKVKKEAFDKYAAAKGRLVVQVRCSVDAIQASIASRWKLWLQAVSMILSAVLGVVAINLGALHAQLGRMDKTTTFWTSILIGVLAGFLAPVARDLVAALEKLRS